MRRRLPARIARRLAVARSPRAARALLAALVALGLSLLATTALAQATGGSFGGGSWGGGGGGGGYSGGGGGGYDSDGGDIDGLFSLVIIAFQINPIFGLVVLAIAIVVLVARSVRGSNYYGREGRSQRTHWNQPNVAVAPQVLSAAPTANARAWMNADVTKIRLALDLSARGPIEAELNALWSTTQVGQKGGLLRVVHRVARLLRAHEASWRWGGESNFHPMSPPQAESIFRQLSDATRQARNRATSSGQAPGSLFLVTIIVGARREIVDFQAHRPEQIRMVLDDLLRLSEQDLVAAEISWLPLETGAGMAPETLKRVYPDMREIHAVNVRSELAGAADAHARGRIYCPFCGKDYARQHPRCVHCGAPRPEGA